jgi:hypothetical protein
MREASQGASVSERLVVNIRRLYLPFTLRRSILTAGVPGSTLFIGFRY